MKAGRGWRAGRRGYSPSQQGWRCRVEPLEERRLLDAAPVAQADLYQAGMGTVLSIASPGVLANDSDADGDAMSVVLTRQPSHGDVALSAQGGLQYLADTGFAGRDTFEYRVLANGVLSAPATVSVDVALKDGQAVEWPVAAGGNGHFYARVASPLNWAQAKLAAEGQTLFGAAGHLATVNSQGEDAFIRATFNQEVGWLGGYQDTKAADYQEPMGGWRWVTGEPWDYVNWAAGEPNDAGGGEDYVELWPLSVGWADQHVVQLPYYYVEFEAPAKTVFAGDDAYVTATGSAINSSANLGVAANDTTPAGATVVATVVTAPTKGTLTLQPDGGFSYQPQAGYQGRDSFRYKLTVNGVDSNVATAWIKVGQNDYPTVARPDTYRVPEDGQLVVDRAADSPDYLENFSDAALPNWLEGTGFVIADGSIRRTTPANALDREYIRTVRGDYLTKDFVAEISFTTSVTPADSLMYFGLGEGVPGGGVEEPASSIYFRIHTPNTADGYVGFTNAPVSDAAILGNIAQAGLHRARIEKVGQQLTVQIDAQYTGTFVPDLSYVVDNLSTFAPFLNGQNTHIFFGTALTNDRFDDLSITMLPRQGVLANDSDGDGALRAELVTGTALGQLQFHADGTFTYQPQPNFSGVEEFTYRATDGISTATTTVRIEVVPVNDPPAANRDFYTWAGAAALNVAAATGVLANDGDLDGDALTAQLVKGPVRGTLALAADGSFVYTPDANFSGVDSFTYQASDGQSLSSPVYVVLSGQPVGGAPLAADDSFAVGAHGQLSIPATQGLLANDYDAQGDALAAVLVRLPEHGRLTLAADGSFVYVPDVGFAGDSFVYRTRAGGQESNLATVTIGALAAEGDYKIWSGAGGNGHAYVLLPNTLSWTAARDYAASLTYQGAPGHLLTITSQAEQDWLATQFPESDAWVGGYQDHNAPDYAEPSGGWKWVTGEPWSFTVWGAGEPNDMGGEDYLHGFPRWNDNRNDNARPGLFVEFSNFPPPAPNVADDLYTGKVGAAISRTAAGGVLANDDFPAGVQAILTQNPSHGAVTLSADGSFTYTPSAGYQGRDSFRYRSSTGDAAATVWLNVGINEAPPVAVADGYVVDEDATFVLGPVSGISVGLVNHWKFDETTGDTAQDVRGGKIATLHNWAAGEAKWVAGRSGGAISISDGDDYLLTEDLAAKSAYTFSLWARRDREGGLNPRLLASMDREWEILSYQEVGRGVGSDLVQADSPPALGVWEHYAVTLVAATGETQVYRNGELVASGTSRAAHPQGAWVIGHSPYLNFADDTWRGAIDDLRIYDRVLAATEIVSLAHDGTSILSNDSDLDGDALSVELVQNVAHGVLALNPDGTFSYTPTANYIGTDTFTYRVTDGSAWSNIATVTLTVRNQPDPTTTVADEYTLEEDVPLNVAAPQGVLANDQDLDGIPVGATVVDNPAHGTLALQPDGSFVYTPAKDYHGPDQFTYKVVDEAGVSNVSVVSLTIYPVNDAPTANHDAYATSQVGVVQTSALRGVLANDTDVEGNPLTAALVEGPAHGALTLNADGSFLYTPAAGFLGQDKFTYRVSDGLLQSGLATVTLTVRQATVDIALRAVANPSAGDTAAALPSSLAAVNVGGEYYVEVWVQDVGAAPAGLPGGQIDLSYDTALSDALGLNHGGLYNLIPTGSINEAGGLVNDFGGGTITPAAAGAPQWARLGYVRVSASAHGLASYQLSAGALQFSRIGGGSVAWDKVDLSETLLVDHQAQAELEVRVVTQPTAVDGAGEVDALPASLPWVDEWSGYWVEVWVRSTDQGAGQGISQAAANLLYDTRYGTAREIQYGPGFTTGKTGTIDDATGRVNNLGAATTRSDVGDDRFALLARVRYAPGTGDQAAVDEAGHSIGPYDLALGLSDPAVRLVGAAANGATDLRAADLPIYAALYDIDDNDQIDYGDLSYFAAAFGKVDVGAIEPPYVWWANFDRQGAVDFGDFSFLAANFGRTKEQGGLEYPANYPAAWTSLSAAALGGPAFDPPATPLGGDDLGMSVRLVARAKPGAGDSAATLPAGLTQVAVGGTYTIEVWVQDTAGKGVTGGLVDIGYPQGRVDGQSLEHGGVYTTFARGVLRDASGKADDLGGGSVMAALGSKPQWVRLGYFTFQVTGAGPLEFKLAPGQLQFSRYGAGNVAWDKVDLGSLTLNPALMGDVNSDGKVDLTDFGVFKSHFGSGDAWSEGDLDGNGRVDLSDFGLFKANFGRTQAALLPVTPALRSTESKVAMDELAHAAAVDRAFAAEEEAEDDAGWMERLG